MQKRVKSNLPAGKKRLINGCIMIASKMEPGRLVEKSELNINWLGISMKYKKLQIMETKHNLRLFMCPNGLYFLSLEKICNEVLKKARTVMVAKDNDTYPLYMYDPDLLPKYDVIQDFAMNAPWVTKDKAKKVTSWQKMMFQLEYDTCNKIELHNFCNHIRKMELRKRYLGKFANYVTNSEEDESNGERSTWGTMIAWPGSINLSFGSVGLCGLVYANQRCELKLAPLSKVKPFHPIQ